LPTSVLEPKQEISPREALAELAIRKARHHLIPFTQVTHATYRVNWHHREIASALEDVERGVCKRLMIFIPPQRGKSELASIRFTAWVIGKHPELNIIETSYAAELAVGFGRKTRNLIDSEEYQDIFPGLRLAEDSQAAGRWNTTADGGLTAAGVGGGITGKRGNIIIIDDPFKDREEADSKTIRDKVDDWYRSVVYTRQAPNGAIILIMTRWHEDDLAGRLIKRMKEPGGEQWRIVQFPEICERNDEVHRKVGDALWPDQYSKEAAELTKVAVGTRAWEALYQQRPSSPEGNIIQREWFQRYKLPPSSFLMRIHSLDTAFKTKKENDWSVLGHWGVNEHGYFLLSVTRVKVQFPELKRLVTDAYDRDHPNWVIVEDKASGQSLIQELQRDTIIPVHAVQVDVDKVARANAVTPLMEAGRVWIPEHAPWVADFLDECAEFKANAEHDDQVDMMTQALAFMKNRTKARASVLG